ncbi:popeye domain-containing 2 isoform X1 [Anguilla anguilla]|uniref:popeye domain-containing 2 isoform X1 n=1 Tax=Anguilla anguilla TaxID=7936 RepID=UPI0015A990BD|nr:popeye domain-containing 2 isoform X1 [Anguilla anguilla]
MSQENLTFLETLVYGHEPCEIWTNGTEGALYQLGNTLLLLGYMGGSGTFGAIYIYCCLAPGFLCHALWGWMTVCGLDVFSWSLLFIALCLLQLVHLAFRLHQDSFPGEELRSLYNTIYLPLDVPLPVFKEVAGACENRVLSLGMEETYALEGKTPINRLSLLLSGRIRVSLEGQFLHYIFPYQFLDSPEWESLRPTEEGNFQVTLTAETDCRYISWPRRKLYLLLAKERYIARLFSVMLGNDIADKLYSLNDKLFAKSGVRLDIRLPSLYHVLAPSSTSDSAASGTEQRHPEPAPANRTALPPHQTHPERNPPNSRVPHRQPWPSDNELPSGEDSTSLVLEDFADMTGSFMDYGSERDYLRE